ncbi:hypothetical protein BMS3Bbin03_00516 [bacterium BMS3Bbin03]|nr:hypothetical protein BMS3Bbin03_00516 [bacterium BMS3Bbin03]HDL78449.1 hypothetical protein [Bacteroidota bacterium]
MTTITVQQKEFPDHFQCDVQLKDNRGAKNFTVTVQKTDYERLTGGRVSPEVLVKKSFEFLLEREPKESILSRFDLMVIGRYFPEYEQEIKNRL